MRMEIAHPTNSQITAVVGWDHLLGFFAEISNRGFRIYQYDNLVVETGQTSLQGLLNLLVNQGFFTDLETAEAHRMLGYVDDVDDIEEPSVRLAAEVIERLKEAAS